MTAPQSDWVRLPDDLTATNDTAAAKALGGIAATSVWWNPKTGEIRARLLTTTGAAERQRRAA